MNNAQSWLGRLGVTVISTAAVVATIAPSAQAATYYTATTGYGVSMPSAYGRPKSGHVGEFRIPYRLKGFCGEMHKTTANADVVGDISDIPGVTGEKQHMIHWITKEAYIGYVTSTGAINKMDTNREGLWYALATWSLLPPKTVNGNYYDGAAYIRSLTRMGKLTTSDVNAINAILDRAKRHGTYKVTVTTPAVLVGQSALGSIKAVNSLGYGAPIGTRVNVAVTSGNAVIKKVSGLTGSNGRISKLGYASFEYTRTGIGQVKFKVTITSPSSTKSRITFPSSSSRQRLLGGTYTVKSYGYGSFDKVAGGPSYTQVCDEACDGTGVVTTSAANAAGAKPIKYAFVNQTGATVGYLDVASGTSASRTLDLKDGDVLTSKYCYTDGVGQACKTSWVAVPGSFEVVCPAWMTAEITVGCNCTTSWASVKFIAPANSSRYYSGRVVLSKDGVEIGSLPAVNVASGQTVVVPITMKVATGLVIEARFSAFRDSAKTMALVNDKTLTKVMVLSVSGTSMTYQKSTIENGDIVSKTTATVPVSKLSGFAQAS